MNDLPRRAARTRCTPVDPSLGKGRPRKSGTASIGKDERGKQHYTPHMPSHSSAKISSCPLSASVSMSASLSGRQERCRKTSPRSLMMAGSAGRWRQRRPRIPDLPRASAATAPSTFSGVRFRRRICQAIARRPGVWANVSLLSRPSREPCAGLAQFYTPSCTGGGSCRSCRMRIG